MNVDSPSNSPNSTCEVQSKYFSSKGGMDESLSDFQEKKTFSGPKNSQGKKAITKPKIKRTRKIKGQKDIRTALKGQKNELIAYSNEFDKVCQHSGIDVDPEQLQLAIALSKSLQCESQENSQETKPLTSQERSGKIRTTLKEYGFVIPDTKITAVRSRKVKKYRKDYKLLLISKEEQQQIIANKYSQVLFNNFESSKTEHFEPVKNSSNLFHIVTNVSYEHLKDNSLFYKLDLVEKTPNSTGSLLRDWSKIPGRPASPVLEVEKLEFDRIDCSQEELDTILSGSLKTAQGISTNKYNLLPQVSSSSDSLDGNRESLFKMDTEFIEIVDLDDENTNIMESGNENTNIENKPIDLTEVEDTDFLTVSQNVRSCSPDIFGDDELSAVMEHHVEPISPKNTLKHSEVMNLTESIKTNSLKVTRNSNSQLSQCIETTRRKSNDSMDMTECVVGSSQPIRENVILEENIDLTQNSNEANDEAIVRENFKEKGQKDLVSMDLTQTSESSEDLPAVHISGKESLDTTIILNEDVYAWQNNKSRVIEKVTSDILCPETDAECEESRSCGLSPIRIASPTAKRLLITVDSEDETYSPINKHCSHLNKIPNKPNEQVNDLDLKELDSDSDKINNSDLSSIIMSSPSANKSSITIDSEDEINSINSHKNKAGNNSKRQSSSIENFINNNVDTEELDSESNEQKHCLSPIIMLSPSGKRLSYTSDIEDKTISHKIGACDSFKRLISPIDMVIDCNLDTEQVHAFSIHNEHSEGTDCSLTDKRKSPSETTGSCTKTKTESFFEEFVHDHSEEEKVLCLDESSNSVTNENIERENYNIDLSQNTHSSVEVQNDVNIGDPNVSFDTSNLGKIGNVSIDYDDMFDDIVQTSASTSQSKSMSSRSQITDLNQDNLEKPIHSDLVCNSSQNSEVFEISDKELDYSLHKSRLDIDNPHDNFDFGGISVVDNLPDLPSCRPSTDTVDNQRLNRSMSDSYLPPVNIKDRENCKTIKYPTKSCSTVSPTPCKSAGIVAKTPKNGEYIVKTDGVTPMLDYEAMSTPEVNAELDKYGLKPFKRKRAIQMLTHLYNQTHPIVASCSQEASPSKRRKPNSYPTQRVSLKKISAMFKTVESPKKQISQDKNEIDKENGNIYEVTTDVPVIRSIECGEDDWVFQKRENSKVYSCRVPLHVAFHNYVSARLRLREAILRYEPVNIDDIHKGLVADGYRYDPKDLLKFMDKKCITVKTADNTKNKKHC